jgi:hypothetical protein
LVSAQKETSAREKVEAAKAAYITKELNLNVEQSQKLWPVYNEYREAQRKNRKLIKQHQQEMAVKTYQEQEMKLALDKLLELKAKELELEKQYVAKFAQAIGYNATARFFRAERAFHRMIFKNLENLRDSELADD